MIRFQARGVLKKTPTAVCNWTMQSMFFARHAGEPGSTMPPVPEKEAILAWSSWSQCGETCVTQSRKGRPSDDENRERLESTLAKRGSCKQKEEPDEAGVIGL